MDAAKKPNAGITRDPNVKIKVEFDRLPFSQRFTSKYLSVFFLKKVVWFLFRLILLIGISYVVLYSFIDMFSGSIKAIQDFDDHSVFLIPKHFSLDSYIAIFNENSYIEAFINTFILSVGCAAIQTISCCLIAYGLAKFKFKGAKWIFLAVILTMIIPRDTLRFSMYMGFYQFDIKGPLGTIFDFPGIFELISGSTVNLDKTYFPLMILSICGLGFKNGLYIFLLRQFYRGVPDELEESAYIDGYGTFKTFIKIILPLSIPMMITVFLFAFSWQWTDAFYSDLFLEDSHLMTDILVPLARGSRGFPQILDEMMVKWGLNNTSDYISSIRYTSGLMIIVPLVVIYVFCQRFLVQGIERSGLTAD